LAKWLITIGIVLVVLGLAWPLLAKPRLGRLPKDVKLEKKGFTFCFPATTRLIVSALIALIALLRWLFRR